MQNVKPFYKHTYLSIPFDEFKEIICKIYHTDNINIKLDKSWESGWYAVNENLSSIFVINNEHIYERLENYFDVKKIRLILYKKDVNCFHLEYEE